MKWHGSPELERFLVPVTSLHVHPENPRRHDLTVIAASLAAFGQVKPIVSWEDPDHGTVIIAGNGTYLAATEDLGWDEIAATPAELSPLKARQYLIADNRTSDLSDYYADQLSAILTDLKDSGQLDGTGWNAEQVDDYAASVNKLAEKALALHADRRPLPEAGTHGPGLREIHLLLPAREEGPEYEQLRVTHTRFLNYVKMLRKEYGTEGVTDTLVECVNRAAKAL